jgi:lactoylglutathione lyase
MEYLHTMIRVTDIKKTIAFFELLGFSETRRMDNEKGRYTLVFLAADGDVDRAKKDQAPTVELTYNWDPEVYGGGRNFGHLRHLQEAHGRRRDDQPATARRPHGLHPHARRRLDRIDPEGRLAALGRALGVDAQHRRVVRRAQAIAALTRLR